MIAAYSRSVETTVCGWKRAFCTRFHADGFPHCRPGGFRWLLGLSLDLAEFDLAYPYQQSGKSVIERDKSGIVVFHKREGDELRARFASTLTPHEFTMGHRHLIWAEFGDPDVGTRPPQ